MSIQTNLNSIARNQVTFGQNENKSNLPKYAAATAGTAAAGALAGATLGAKEVKPVIDPYIKKAEDVSKRTLIKAAFEIREKSRPIANLVKDALKGFKEIKDVASTEGKKEVAKIYENLAKAKISQKGKYALYGGIAAAAGCAAHALLSGKKEA